MKPSALLPVLALLAFAAGCGAGPLGLESPVRRSRWTAGPPAVFTGGDARVRPLAPAPSIYVMPARRDGGLGPR